MNAYSLTRLAPPAEEPVTLAEAKLYLRIDHEAEDDAVAAMTAAARELAEGFTRRSFVSSGWRLECETDGAPIRLPMGVATAVNAVSSIDDEGTVQVVAADAWRLESGYLIWESWPTQSRVRIDYTAGYGDAVDVPAPIRQALLAQVLWLYDRRGAEAWSPQALALLSPYREILV